MALQVSVYTIYFFGTRFQFKISNFLLFQTAVILSWVKGKSEDYVQKYNKVIQAHNILSKKYNEFKFSVGHKDSENAHLSKELIEVKAALSAWETELKKVKSDVKYCEDKSISIKLFTTIKVCAKMLKEYTEGTLSSWNLDVAFST